MEMHGKALGAVLVGIALLFCATACGTTDRVEPAEDATLDAPDVQDAVADPDTVPPGCDPCGITGTPPQCEGDVQRLPRQVQDPVTCVCSTVWEDNDCTEAGRVCRDGQCVAPDGCTSDDACVGTAAPECDGDTMVVRSGYCDLAAGACASRETRTDCPFGCEEGVCREEEEGTECRVDDECPYLGRPQCVSDTELRGNRGRCERGTCRLEAVITQCLYGCGPQEFGVDACLPEPPCPDDPCEGVVAEPYCDAEDGQPVSVTPTLQRDPDAECACVEVDLRWLCGQHEVCDLSGTCVRECAPCPVLRPGPPICEGEVSTQLVDIELNPETCACEEVYLRRDCAEEDLRCVDGQCVDRNHEP